MNESLRRAMLRARLRENDVAAHLGVDPKTVRRWLSGRVPYPGSRAALADLVGADEADLWPEAGGPLSGRSRPEELAAVYPHRWAISRDVWTRFFESAEHEIGVLAYSALFLAEDAGLLSIIRDKASHGVRVRIALGDPDSACRSPTRRRRGHRRRDGREGPQRPHALPVTPENRDNVEIRLHQTTLYNSIYRADDQIFVNQHAYGVPASHAPVFCFRVSTHDEMINAYLRSFDRVWGAAKSIA